MAKDSIFRIYSMTKPVVSVAAMMLWEEGRFFLDEAIGKYLPELNDLKVAVQRDGTLEQVRTTRKITIQDLFRHTSGLTYEFRGSGPIHKMYMDAKIYSRNQTNAEQTANAGQDAFDPSAWQLLGIQPLDRCIGQAHRSALRRHIGAFLQKRIFEPLSMSDTAFHVPPPKHARLAEAFAKDPESGGTVQLLEVRTAPKFESGGGGLVSTAGDYARFLQMMLNRGTLDGTRLLSRKTVELMTADHLGDITGAPDLLVPGYGFGLGFAVRLHAEFRRCQAPSVSISGAV